jgi:hypothetical protein
MATYGFLYETDDDDDDGYREITAETYEAARMEWVRQVTIEGQKVHLEAAQRVKRGA